MSVTPTNVADDLKLSVRVRRTKGAVETLVSNRVGKMPA